MNKLELKFRFRAIKELLEITNLEIAEIDKLRLDFTKTSLIAHIGNKHAGGKLTIDEIEDMIDEDGTLIKYILKEFSEQILKYLVPNETSQSPLPN
jgi:hypothetical protein